MGVWLRALRYRGFAVCTALACLVVLYQLAGNLLMSFGWSASGSQLLGFDLPPLVVAEQTVCASETFAVLLPVGTALALSAPISTGYAQLLACRSSVRGVVRQVLAAGLLMGAVFWGAHLKKRAPADIINKEWNGIRSCGTAAEGGSRWESGAVLPLL